ncbi:MAG: hypothetical protein ACRDRL_32215, partial [Sciscionella sp.]
MRQGLHRALTSRTVLVLAALLFVAGAIGVVGVTSASFTAETKNQTSTVVGGWVGEASALQTPVATAYDAALGWTAATHVGTLTDQLLLGVDRGTTANCTGASYSTLTNVGTSGRIGTGTSLTPTGDWSGGGIGSLNGHYYCFQLKSYDDNWVSTGAAFPVVHLGLFPISVTFANGGTAGRADIGDTITIVFNQNVAASSLPSGTFDVCINKSNSGLILIGDTSGCNNGSDTYT